MINHKDTKNTKRMESGIRILTFVPLCLGGRNPVL
jgi:hypothetical protein